MLKAHKNRSKENIIPEGVISAVCIDQVENNEEKHLSLYFAVTAANGNQYVDKTYELTLDINTETLTDISLCLGEDSFKFNETEYDPENLVGKQVQLVIIHRRNKGSKRIPSIVTMLPASETVVELPKDYVRIKDRQKAAANSNALDKAA